MLACDVLVVGGGPAGSCAAREAALAGAQVLIVERRRQVGIPVQCAEYVPRQLAECVPWDDAFVSQSVETMRTHLPGGEIVETAGAGYTIDRDRFDRYLAASAVSAGARLMLQTSAVHRIPSGALLRTPGGEQAVRATVVIGADGPRSTVARWIGQANPGLMAGAQVTVRLARPLPATEVYFDTAFVGGYAWRFPKRDFANVGVGVEAGRSVKDALDRFLSMLGVRPADITRRVGGYIPCGGPPALTWKDDIVLVGDAAGQTHPITGAGVANACLCGQMAGRAAAEAALSGDSSRLSGYEHEWRAFLGGVLAHAVDRRRFLTKRWTANLDELSAALRWAWVAFPGYGRRAPNKGVES